MDNSESSKFIVPVVVNWNRSDDTRDCVSSLINQTRPIHQIIVVDNGSTEYPRFNYKSTTSRITIIRSEDNLGFAGGVNLGIREAIKIGGTHVLVINNDTLADPFLIQALIDGQNKLSADVVAPLIFYYSDPGEVWSSGGNIVPCLVIPLDAHNRHNPPALPLRRTFLSGCCLLIRTTVFESVGLFDEEFFMYYEDMDFAIRAQKAGIIMGIIPNAILWHKASKSSGGYLSPNERYWMARSLIRYSRRYTSFQNAIPIWSHRLFSALLWTFRLFLNRRFDSLTAYWRGIIAGMKDSVLNTWKS